MQPTQNDTARRDAPPGRRRSGLLVCLATLATVLLGSAHLAPVGATTSAGVASTLEPAGSERLVYRDRGPAVGAWQRQMNIVAGQGIIADGVFGPATETATTNFQRFFGLVPDGVVEELTREVARYILGVTQPGYTGFQPIGDVEHAGFAFGAGYCLDVRDYPSFALRCSNLTSGAVVSASAMEIGHPSVGVDGPVLFGTVAAEVAAVHIDGPDNGSVTASLQRNVPGLDRALWISPVRADEAAVVRALDVNGEEIRRVVISDVDDHLIIELGDRGESVREWQARLNRSTGAGLGENGVFGGETLQRTANFQRFFGLAADGVVGAQTREVMAFVLALADAGESPEGPEPIGEPTTGDVLGDAYPGELPAALLTDVRISGHDGFDRIVFEFDQNLPEFQGGYVDAPIIERPSGRPVPVPGGAFLEVTMARASSFDLSPDDPGSTFDPDRVAGANTEAIVEAVRTQDFEWYLTWTIGLDQRSEYSVTQLQNPSRIVVDVRIPK